MPGAGLPAHVRRKDWVLMSPGQSPIHSDAARDIARQGYCFFQELKKTKSKKLRLSAGVVDGPKV
jgi:hypothetical protein